MRRFIFILGLIFAFLPVIAQQQVAFEQELWEQAVKKAKKEGKLVFVDIASANCAACERPFTTAYKSTEVADIYNASFVSYRLLPQDEKYLSIVNKYAVKAFPSYLYMQPNGTLVYYSAGAIDTDGFIKNAQSAILQRNDEKPLAQLDVDYANQKLDKSLLYAYIEKRTALGLDNADIIDQYALVTSHQDMLKTSVLTLLIETNKKINANGAFFKFVLDNKDKVKNAMRYSSTQVDEVLANSIEYTFNKACNAKNTTILDAAIAGKLACGLFDTASAILVKNEYKTRYAYVTKQPLLLSNFVLLYANTVMQQEQEMKAEEPQAKQPLPPLATKDYVNQKGLFPATTTPVIKNEQMDISYSFMLRDAAQYVVEMLSNKRMLNNALVWSQKAIDLFGNYSNYETHAYVLYKLGKRSEAISNMEKAYSVVPSSDGSSRNQVAARLIKMKRGERIW